jgi:hypothetical protein
MQTTGFLSRNPGPRQGDQIGRISGIWATFNLISHLKIAKLAPQNFGCFFSQVTDYTHWSISNGCCMHAHTISF